MTASIFSKKVIDLLNEGTESVPAPVAARLAKMRQIAVEHHAVRQQAQYSVIDVDRAGTLRGTFEWGRAWMPTLFILVLAAAMLTWQHHAARHHMGALDEQEIDLVLLSDDLPTRAYLDSDFPLE